MAQCRRLVAFFNSSSQATEILLSKQNNSVPVNVMQDVITRWWSTYLMGLRLLRLRPYFSVMVAESTLAADLNLTDGQWIILKDTVSLLEPFMIAQNCLEGEKYVTISFVLVIITQIRINLKELINNESSSEHVLDLSTAMLENFNNHWGSGDPGTVYAECETLGPRLRPKGIPRQTILATYLDPRTKKLQGLTANEKLLVRLAIKDKLLRQQGAIVPVDMEPGQLLKIPNVQEQHNNRRINEVDIERIRQTDALFALLGDPLVIENNVVEIPDQLGLEELVEAELTLYDNELPLQRVIIHRITGHSEFQSPLVWWKDKQSKFPMLSVLASKYLAIQATSAPSERLFSAAGLTISKDRARLTQDNAAGLVFLHENLAPVNAWRSARGLHNL